MSNSGKRNRRRRQNGRGEDGRRRQGNQPLGPSERPRGFIPPQRGTGASPASSELFAASVDENPTWARRAEANLRAIPRLVEAVIFVAMGSLTAISVVAGVFHHEFRQRSEDIQPLCPNPKPRARSQLGT